MIVFPTTEQVEIFANDRGDITIKQDNAMGDAPSLIAIPLIHVTAVINALRKAKKDAESE